MAIGRILFIEWIILYVNMMSMKMQEECTLTSKE
nr:MAG TPA: hypothetical protein [Crassvirales sp.]